MYVVASISIVIGLVVVCPKAGISPFFCKMEPLEDGCPGRFRRRLGELEAPEQPWSERIGDE